MTPDEIHALANDASATLAAIGQEDFREHYTGTRAVFHLATAITLLREYATWRAAQPKAKEPDPCG
jgi:hypothetical protein